MADQNQLPPGWAPSSLTGSPAPKPQATAPTSTTSQLPPGWSDSTLTGNPAPPPEPKSVMGFLGNAVSSVGNVLEGVGNAVLHPMDTAGNLVRTASGAAQSIPGVGSYVSAAEDKLNQATGSTPEQSAAFQAKDKAMFEALKQHYVNRYGSVSNALNTLYNDPAGTALDVATVADPAARLLGSAAEGTRIADAANAVKSAVGDTVADAVRPVANLVKGSGPSQAAQEIAAAAGEIPMSMGQATGIPLVKAVEYGVDQTKLGSKTAKSLITAQENYFARNAPAISQATDATIDSAAAAKTLMQNIGPTATGDPLADLSKALPKSPDAVYQYVSKNPEMLDAIFDRMITYNRDVPAVQSALRDSIFNNQAKIAADGGWMANADKLKSAWESVPDGLKSRVMSPETIKINNNLYDLLDQLSDTPKTTPSVAQSLLGRMGSWGDLATGLIGGAVHGIPGVAKGIATAEVLGGSLGLILRNPKIYGFLRQGAKVAADSGAGQLLSTTIVNLLKTEQAAETARKQASQQ